MKTLHEIETRFIAAILGNDMSGLDEIVAPSPIAPAQRLQIYRNNFLISLAAALAASFPVLRRLVGEAYFEQTARRFAETNPPCVPMLSAYGETFPRFLAKATRAPDFAYLADVGRLEWAINCAWHADDAMPAGEDIFAGLTEDIRKEVVLAPHPSARLVTSPWPVLDIWRANQPDADADLIIDLGAGGIELLVWRLGIDVVWRVLDRAEAAFVRAVLDMRTLARAAELAIAANVPEFDPGALCAELLASGLFIGRFLPAQT